MNEICTGPGPYFFSPSLFAVKPCHGVFTGDSAPEIKRRVSITRDCMMALDRNI